MTYPDPSTPMTGHCGRRAANRAARAEFDANRRHGLARRREAKLRHLNNSRKDSDHDRSDDPDAARA